MRRRSFPDRLVSPLQAPPKCRLGCFCILQRQEATCFPPSPSSGSMARSKVSSFWFCHLGKAAGPGTPQVIPVRFTICKRLDRWAWLVAQKCHTGYSRGPAEQHIFSSAPCKSQPAVSTSRLGFFPPVFRKSLCHGW